MNDDFYDDGDESCPKCGHSPTRWRDCDAFCDDGFVDLYDEDPVFFSPGETEMCRECWGTGVQRWCPNCGCDIALHEYLEELKAHQKVGPAALDVRKGD